ncbi:5'-Nucleotidase domain-containing protein [Rhodopirellula maiorica SM1]|uniref:5'-Nucleotidase domain-containing protein n=1 Tax=Rhodopirellula maiorica SM1 TaxID=1265738 RepID=M5RMQ0_9BACT|nr:bifunctional metallophosphatase/5'-nucleotidase [Rhodopirellula maiorica]EMI20603.1 5'-Nucleotidase domain-containing protein [Rhodopirellula maiorica SM1]
MKPIGIFMAAIVGCLATTLSATAANSIPANGADPNIKKFSIAFVNDIHAQLEPHPELFWRDDHSERVHNAGGLSRIATAFKQLEAQRPHGMLKIDGGDTFQGSGPGAWTQGEVMVRPLNALGLDVAVPGNWSVAYGAKQLQSLSEKVNYPMVAANIVDEKTGQRSFPPYLVKQVNGVKIGLLGFTDPDVPTRQPPHMSKGLHFQAAKVLQPLIDELRNEEKVDVVVLITHIGLHKAVPLTRQLRGVDISLSADTHERTYEPIEVGDVWVVEAGAFGSLVGVMDITMSGDKIVDRQWELIELREDKFVEDEHVKGIVDEVLAPHRERMNREIGHTDIWLERYNVMSTSMDRLIADAVKESAGTDIALSNGFRFSPPTAPGPITEADLWNWLPLNLEIKVGKAYGKQLIDYWENEFENVFSHNPSRLYGGWLARPSTNMDVQFDSTAKANERLRSLEIDGNPVDPDKTYSLAAGARDGQPADQIHRVKRCRVTKQIGLTTHDAVRQYLAQRGDVTETGKPPVRCVVRSDVLRSQYLAFIKERQQEREAEMQDANSPADPNTSINPSSDSNEKETNDE